ncbi:MAG: tetratricopeptide repeat protein [Alphaproteobacteria bacterium]|nr:tetratricopeptide repeat protein [Alphaproteobacteria bacterium]
MTQSPDARGLFAQALRLHQAGRLDDAVAHYRRAIALEPELAAAHSNLGTALCELGLLEEAEASYRKALALQPGQAQAHNNLGTVLFERGALDEAVSCYRDALALQPDYAEALNNLGAALFHRGDLENAVASARQALALVPDYAQALGNLGRMLSVQGRFAEAGTAYRRLTVVKPQDSEGLNGLAEMLAIQGDAGAALETILQSLRIRDTSEARRIFAEIAGPLRWAGDNAPLRDAMLRAITETWVRPSELSRSAASLVKQGAGTGASIARAATAWPRRLTAAELFGPEGSAALARDVLFRALLGSGQNADLDIERFLTMARRVLLEAVRGGGMEDAGMEFHAALARQCFINEYVFFRAEDEASRAADLRDALSAALGRGEQVSVPHILAVASYFPLLSIPGADKLFDFSWPEPIAAILAQQLREPQEEACLRAAMPKLTGIENAISQLNRQQYEANPYPRWVRIPRQEQVVTINEYLRKRFPLADVRHAGAVDVADILSVGCGTGQLALEIAQGIRSRTLAVDLSLASLGYAKRKALERGLSAIEFAQADLLELGDIGRTFDVVECSGVLHHLADPYAGWRAMLPLSRSGGFMMVGLYSEAARKSIVRAQEFAARAGYGISADGIRRCRQDLLNADAREDFDIAASDDFFGISSCRDLLFHVGEARTRLPAIQAFLRENDLTFLGFETDFATRQAYRQRFPGDPAATDLHNWHLFEGESPAIFSGMYRFWVQKG